MDNGKLENAPLTSFTEVTSGQDLRTYSVGAVYDISQRLSYLFGKNLLHEDSSL